MSVNKYDSTTGILTTLVSGERIWIGTKAQHEAAVRAGTMPSNCLVSITDDEEGLAQEVTADDGKAVTSNAVYNAFTAEDTTLKDSVPTQNSEKPIISGAMYDALRTTNWNILGYIRGDADITDLNEAPTNSACLAYDSASHYPTGAASWGVLVTFGNTNTYKLQILCGHDGYIFYRGPHPSGGWQGWKKITGIESV